MTIRFNLLSLLIASTVLFILVFALIRGCDNAKAVDSANSTIAEIEAKRIADSISMSAEITDYMAQADMQDGIIQLKDNQLQAKGDSLEEANKRILSLLSKHKPQNISADTTITTVPNEYIEDCEGCFSELAKGRESVISYKTAVDKLKREYDNKRRTDSVQISKLSLRNTNLTGTLRDAISATARERQKLRNELEPTRKLFLSAGGMILNYNKISAGFGAGLGYQDLHNRMFSAKYYTTQSGPIYEGSIYLPLSLKRKR